MTGEPPTPGPDEVRLGPYPAGEVGLDDVGLAVVAMLAALGVTSAVSAVRFTPRQSSPPVLQVVLRVGVLLVVVTVVVVVAHELLHWTTASLFGYQPQFEAGVSWLGLELALAFPDELRLRRHELVVMLAPQLVTVAGVAIQLWGPRSRGLRSSCGGRARWCWPPEWGRHSM